MVCLVILLPIPQTFARIDDETLKFYAKNNILYYDPTGSSSSSGCFPSNGDSYRVNPSEDPWYAEGDYNRSGSASGNYYCGNPGHRTWASCGCGCGHSFFNDTRNNVEAFRSIQADPDFFGMEYIYAENYDIDVSNRKLTRNSNNSNVKYYLLALPEGLFGANFETFEITFEKVSEPKRFILIDVHAASDVDHDGVIDQPYTEMARADPDNFTAGAGILGVFWDTSSTLGEIYRGTGGMTSFHRLTGSSETIVHEISSTPKVAGSTAEEIVWNYLLGTKKFSDEQTAAIIGNLQYPSNLNPAFSPGGIANWPTERFAGLRLYLQNEKPELLTYIDDTSTYGSLTGDEFLQLADNTDAKTLIKYELDFLIDEIETQYPDFLNKTTVEEASEYFAENIGNDNLKDEKLASANTVFSSNHKANSSPCGGTGNYSSLQELVLKYAWPDWHDPGTREANTPLDDYRIAASKSSYKGCNNGQDCGGFVTILLRTSGFEPNYNSDNAGATGQRIWAMNNGWVKIGTATKDSADISVSDLQPGDVAFATDLSSARSHGRPYDGYYWGHTWVFVGDIEGFNSQFASASYCQRYPMAATEGLTTGGYRVTEWWRKAR